MLDHEHIKLGFKKVTWSDFCKWLIDNKKQVEKENSQDYKEYSEMTFTDGSIARFESKMSDPTPGYSEYTPGSEGSPIPPDVYIKE